MPIFDYRCEDCGEEFEYFSVRSADKPHCPGCGSTELEKKPGGLFTVGKSASGKRPLTGTLANAGNGQANTGHRCTSRCSHGAEPRAARGPDGEGLAAHGAEGHVVGCARSYADSLRDKYR
jgi:putative FmdB family regulatory protein